MLEKSFSKITIRDIMLKANYRRQTFYDYFPDKYDILPWVLEKELNDYIFVYVAKEDKSMLLKRFLAYLETNKDFFCSAIRSSESSSFDYFFFEQVYKLVEDCMKEVSNFKYESFVIRFFTYGMVGICTNWLLSDCREDRKTLNSAIEKIMLEFECSE